MLVPEPTDALWAEVSNLTRWPDSDEDAVRTMSAGWRRGGEHFTQASTFNLGPVADGWTDAAGQIFHGRTTEGLRAVASTGEQMTAMAGHAEAFAGEVTGVKNGIHALMAANQAGFAQTATLPADVRAGFVQQVAGMVDAMKAEAAARISAAGPALAQQPAQAEEPPGPPNRLDPQSVNDWWNGLTEDERDYFRVRPGSIADLDGIPARERSEANLSILDEKIAFLEYLASDATGAMEVGPELATLTALRDRIDASPEGTRDELFLLKLDQSGNGQAIVSIGNPDTATNVATLVPGTGTNLGNFNDQINRAGDLRDELTSNTATIAWLGYEAPANLGEAHYEDRANSGADRLARFQNGLRATHVGDIPSNNVVVAHSYGTTVAGHAARDLGLNADELVLVSSTDPGVQHVSELHLLKPDGTPVDASEVPLRVHATTPDNDLLAKTATRRFGNDPTDPAFGADVITAPLGPIWNAHSQAFEEGKALNEITDIVEGRR